MKNVHHCTQVEFFPILHHLKLSPIDIIFKAYKTGFAAPFCRILFWQQHAHIWVYIAKEYCTTKPKHLNNLFYHIYCLRQNVNRWN